MTRQILSCNWNLNPVENREKIENIISSNDLNYPMDALSSNGNRKESVESMNYYDVDRQH